MNYNNIQECFDISILNENYISNSGLIPECPVVTKEIAVLVGKRFLEYNLIVDTEADNEESTGKNWYLEWFYITFLKIEI